jgi:nudix-type nucleoside diphosphatase (YffH/AdpP family)
MRDQDGSVVLDASGHGIAGDLNLYISQSCVRSESLIEPVKSGEPIGNAGTARDPRSVADRNELLRLKEPIVSLRSEVSEPRSALTDHWKNVMPPEIVRSQSIYSGWSRLRKVTIRRADGSPIEREVEDHGNAACVLPYHRKARTAVLVRQLRAPLLAAAGAQDHLEAIAGLIENEAAVAAAAREAKEEAGIDLSDLTELYSAWTMPGLSTERMHFCLAQYAHFSPQRARFDREEQVTPVELPIRELVERIDAGELCDVKTLLLVRELQIREPALFEP